MVGMERIGIVSEERRRRGSLAKARAEELLKESDFSELFENEGMLEVDETASVALKAVLAEKAAEYALEAVKFTRKKGLRKVGAAAVLISTQKERW